MRGPTEEELLAIGEVTMDTAPVDSLQLTDEERHAFSKPDPKWTDGAIVSAMIADRIRADGGT